MMLPLAAWLHGLDKMALHLSWLPNGGIAWYGLSYLAGFIIAWLLLRRVMTTGATPMGAPFSKEAAGDLVMAAALGVMLGGRLGYCVFYKPDLFVDFSKEMPFWGVLALHKGGMASHGGMIGALIAVWWWGRKYKAPLLYLFDLVAFAAPLGLCMGRIANFVNGELYGRACDASYKLAVQFPQEISNDWGRADYAEGARKYAALRQALPDAYVGTNEAGALVIRNPDELGLAAKTDPLLAQVLHDHLTPRHPSQLYGAAAEGVLVFLILFIVWRKPRSPGLVAGLFGIVYAAARVSDEFFRMPDAQFIKEGDKLPLVTQGQLLSFFVFAAGVTCVVVALRSKGKKLGGWGKIDAGQ